MLFFLTLRSFGSQPLTHPLRLMSGGLLMLLMLTASGCGLLPKWTAAAQVKSPDRRGGGDGKDQPIAVDVAIATTAGLTTQREYTGTTQPFQEVIVRAQTEGQLRQLNVDVGDRVQQGQTLATIDDTLLTTATTVADAELTARRAEIIQLQSQVNEAETQVEQTRLQLQQAESDAARYEKLAKAGAIAQQQAEQSRTQAGTAAKILQSAQDKVRTQEQAIVAANGRIVAQQAVVDQQQERRSYAVPVAPIAGTVLSRSTEAGNLVQVGNELLRLGDFGQVKVTVQVSELDLADVRVGSTAKVRLDAFPKEALIGRVSRISPVANSTSRLVPIEVIVPNSGSRLSSGLLARVSFSQTKPDQIVVPLSAFPSDRGKRPAKPTGEAPDKSQADKPQADKSNPEKPEADKPQTDKPKTDKPNSGSERGRDRGASEAKKSQGTLFVVTGEGEQANVSARSVTLGEQIDGKVQILSGLSPGERFVARSGRPLKDGDAVRLSILSEK
jgi:HlyD family secretion protein